MTIEEFKFIFYMEWAHRNLGRFIGLSVILPGLYFASRGYARLIRRYMTSSIKWRALAIATMVGSQGVLGWCAFV
jgi:heme a synthase